MNSKHITMFLEYLPVADISYCVGRKQKQYIKLICYDIWCARKTG